MKLGDFVRLRVPADRKPDCFARGRIVATEQYTDFNGTRSWIYVRWFDGDGKPEQEACKHAIQDLEQHSETLTPAAKAAYMRRNERGE